MERLSTESRALLALLLIAPVPSIGSVAAFWIAPGTELGGAIYGAGKVWICLLPLIWWFRVERRPLSIARPNAWGLIAGLASGLLISAAIVVAYQLLGPERVGVQMVRDMTARNGLDEPRIFALAAVAIALLNALVEEYVFRWFITEQCRRLLPTVAAVILSATIFTTHHVIVLKSFFDWPITLLASAGVAMGGLIWAGLYLRFNSIWPGYVSHILVDLAVMAVGWHLIFVAR